MKNIIENIKQHYKTLSIAVGIGIVLGVLFTLIFSSPNQSINTSTHQNTNTSTHQHEQEEPTTWTCSMHPQIKQEKPGDCPICGMDLIPLEKANSGDDNIDPDEIMLTESAAKLADIQTTMVKKGNPSKTIFLQGKVEADERNIAELTARFGGRLEKLFVNFTGERVQKGQKLATIYSPELVTAQRELLEAVSLKENRPQIYKAAKAKLKLWDLSDAQISAIEEKGEPKLYFDILAPINGTVMKRHVAVGDYVKMGDPLFKVVNLSTVWVMFDAYEADLPWIEKGDNVEFAVEALPGKTFEAKVSFIDPFINPQVRTAKVRVEIRNPEDKLKPGMFVSGTLHSTIAAKSNQLLIPKSSILWTGKRSVVYVKIPERESPSFLYREIELGPEAGNFYVVASGLDEGEEIATNGVFKIDAAAQLEGKRSMMNPKGEKVSTGHDHDDMQMGSADEGKTKKTYTLPEDYSAPDAFQQQLTVVYHEYIDMKDAFVASDTQKVSNEAGQVKKVLDEVDMGLLDGDAHMKWMDHLEILNRTIETISKSGDLEEQRKTFSEFNLAFYKAVKTFGLEGVKTHYQYCPMANRDQGAYWFSNEEEIKNPYFGESMLKCGENREVFE
ncbi:Cation efflux system protein CusB precursor [Salinivirga cyanobacteriivorans]|uniref:Cation efflux system protein CusB n=1 Tax=Salinivirga cyanobacteriivorans TaxID=1307839 RepID=A0A0S2I508_9BACT|nr:efflux RND transporter periplasmic adaptor subunit [Salinivirga cyanobacteriivorans]ALO17277.1 Cation efflux system protein CusB precursor [Salinivirga cyanobacteriivorans]